MRPTHHRRTRLLARALLAPLLGLGALAALAPAQSGPAKASAYALLDLADLAKLKVYSVSKYEETWWGLPSAVHVITGEDLYRSGATRLTEALRLAPGVEVAAINAQRAAVTIRGFNTEFAGKLLVLQDGRSLYTPHFGGVYWDAQDTLLRDLDRVEVVRGPGGTAWGMNAVNGVVNFITKSARDTQGSYVEAAVGTGGDLHAGARTGGRVGEGTWYRVYAKTSRWGETPDALRRGTSDDWRQSRAGFRLDSHRKGGDRLTLQGDAFVSDLLQYSGGAPDRFAHWGANVLGRWTRRLDRESDWTAQVYADLSRRDSRPASSDTDNLDVELRRRLPLGERQAMHFGAHFRHVRNEAIGVVGHFYDPPEHRMNLMSLFVEDAWTVVPEQLTLTAGTKLERNEFTGWEALPNVRLAWQPSRHLTSWAAVSSGVRTPDLTNADLNLRFAGTPAIISRPNPDLKSQRLIAYELGWRWRAHRSLTLDLVGFAHEYRRLESNETTFTAAPPTLLFTLANRVFGESQGVELSTRWQPKKTLRLSANYSLLQTHLHRETGSTDTTETRMEGSSPQQQASLWLATDMRYGVTLDLVARYVGGLPALRVPAYVAVDLRVAWRFAEGWEAALAGRNLLDRQHLEFNRSQGFPVNSEIPRAAHLTLSREF
jgi:iron complex outermembrane receptor protein